MHQDYCPMQILGQILEVHLVHILDAYNVKHNIEKCRKMQQKFKMQLFQGNIRFKHKLSRCSISIILMVAPILFGSYQLVFSMHFKCCQKSASRCKEIRILKPPTFKPSKVDLYP